MIKNQKQDGFGVKNDRPRFQHGETGVLFCFPVLFLLLGMGIVTSNGCGGKSKAAQAIEEVENDIKKLFADFKKASEENEFETLYECCSPETIRRMIFEAIVTMGTTARSKESEQLLARYIDQEKLKEIGDSLKNPTQEQVVQMYIMCISKPQEMFIDSYRLINKLNPDRKKPKFGELSDLKIAGNTAKGKTTITTTRVDLRNVPGSKESLKTESTETRDIDVYFIRIQGNWFYATQREWSGVGG